MTTKVISGAWNGREASPESGGAGEDVSEALAVEAAPEANEHATLGLVELLLKDPDRVDSNTIGPPAPPAKVQSCDSQCPSTAGCLRSRQKRMYGS